MGEKTTQIPSDPPKQQQYDKIYVLFYGTHLSCNLDITKYFLIIFLYFIQIVMEKMYGMYK